MLRDAFLGRLSPLIPSLLCGLAACSLFAPKDSELLGGNVLVGADAGAAESEAGSAGDGAGVNGGAGGDIGLGGAGGGEAGAGGGEAGAGGSDADAGGCPANAVFCDDFDRGELGATWDDANLQYATLDRAGAHSPPAAMHVLLPEQAQESSALLTKRVAAASSDLRVSFYLRVNAARDVYPVGLFFDDAGYRISLHVDGFGHDELALAEQADSKLANGDQYAERGTNASLPADGVWRQIEVVVRRTSGTVAVRVDGIEVLAEAPLFGAAFARTGTATLGLGLFFAAPGLGWDADFDDLVVDAL